MKLKSFRASAAFIPTTLMLVVAVATTVASAQTYTDLYNFDLTHGSNPWGILAQGRDGNLYGTTFTGGANLCPTTPGCGTVIKITPSGTLKVLYDFDGVDGSEPYGGLTLGTDGNFYGTTSSRGANNYGTIFKITKSGSLTTLYNFTGGADGGLPWAPPIQGTDGNFYGTTQAYGTAYKITPSGTFTLLASLPGGSHAPLLLGTDGNFYGTTNGGGTYAYGTVFKMTPKGTVTIVYNFDFTHGSAPEGPLIQGNDGNFYGTAYSGGMGGTGCSYGCGTAFKLTPHGDITVLHKFKAYGTGGYQPTGLVQATDGNFYGVTLKGGTAAWGVIFRITPARTYSVLYNFDSADGASPFSTPMQHTNSKIYGLAELGGASGYGVFYSLDVGLGPFVSLVSTLGEVGKTVEVLGQGFTGTSAVSFNGTAAAFTVVSDTYLTATVPSGATTGSVTVTTPGGTLTSSKPFRVKP
ncbi:MAG: choice-of-anchor tandem repeat GloVer-containing protein [Terriglobales bacterium]